ncbi:hypothetical protein [Enterococcus gallinarum]|uniref:hypothetical protein n=1 Tax=Enterococcus gallinarum TaxID=1353 RepID=UPI0027DF0D7B|nr:hypothetical protein [Enterococcus gallinarum]MDQ6112741.1 hypothetical protein [Enterococcus gallinarum]
MKANRIRAIGGTTLILLLGTCLFLLFQNVSLRGQVKEYQADTQLLHQSEANLKQDIETLSNKYDELYKEKNGTANKELIMAVKILFASIYDYDTSKADGDIIVRKDKAKEGATDKVVEYLFPEDSSKTTTTVDSVSRQTKDPEVYLMSSDSRQLQALVVVDYEVSIAGSNNLTGHYMYKVTYNNELKKINSIENVGEFY